MMLARIDILTSAQIEECSSRWLEQTNEALKTRSIDAACLLKVFRRVNLPGYAAVSIAIINEPPDDMAFNSVDQGLGAANLFRPVDRCHGPCFVGDVRERMIIVNPYRISVEEAPANAEMWLETATMMKDKLGFMSATLFQTITPGQGDYHFVSMAEWASEDAFLSIFGGEDYHAIVAPYQEKFQICFARTAYASEDDTYSPHAVMTGKSS